MVTVDENSGKGFAARLREIISDSGLAYEPFAKNIDSSVSGIKKWLSGETTPTMKNLIKITDAYKINLDWLVNGNGQKRGGFKLYEDGLFLKIYDVELSAGFGCFTRDEFLLDTIIIPARMVIEYNLNKACVGAKIKGVSMEPQLHEKDIAIIDTSVVSLEDDGIYAFNYNGCCYIKQLQNMGTEIKAKSINPAYDSWIIKPDVDFKITGKYKGRFSIGQF